MEKDTVRNSFQRGFQWYQNNECDLSIGQIEAMFPDVDVQAFCQGIEDAMHNDTFRLNK